MTPEPNIFWLISDSPFVSFFLAMIAASAVRFLWRIFWRHMSIRKHGWPPAHCDADGSFRGEGENG